MLTVSTHFLSTEKLVTFASFLRNDANKITDALFVENLIAAIEKNPGADKSCIDRWLKAAFEFPSSYEKYNCIDVYNFSFYQSIIEKL